MINSDRYSNIIKVISMYYGIDNNNFISSLKDKEKKYLLVLFLSKYKCINQDQTKLMLNVKSTRSVSCTLKKAEEKFFINREFRMLYFELEKKLEKFEGAV